MILLYDLVRRYIGEPESANGAFYSFAQKMFPTI